jgi:putative hydrolase of the HAD superfamily
MSDIKCVVFDWGGVLIENPVEEFALKCSNMIGANVKQLKETYAEFAGQFERGKIRESDLWKMIGNKLNILIINDKSIWYKCFKNIYSPRKDMFNLARILKQNGYLVALLSNTEIPAMNFFKEQNYDMFDYTVFSCKEGFAKPEPELYNILLQKIKIPAQQTLFIDDKYDNIKTANQLQMNAIYYKNYEDLLLNFQKYSITI